jgi:hypothetical protein
MSKYYFIILLATAPFLSRAQIGGFLKKVKNQASQKISQRAENRISKTMDKAL